MFKKSFISVLVIAFMLFITGGSLMAEDILSAKAKNIVISTKFRSKLY